MSHEYTDYTLVNELYNQGYEIALHSISHVANQEYWRDASNETLMREFGDQKIQIAHFANISIDSIHGNFYIYFFSLILQISIKNI